MSALDHRKLSVAAILLAGIFGPALLAQSAPPPTLYEQALALIQKQQLQPGIALLEKVLEAAPGDLRALNLMGIALTASGKIEEANTHFQKAIAQNPRFYPAIKNLAINEMTLKRTEEAKVHLNQVLQHDPKDPVVHLALGEIHFEKKQFSKAVSHYEQSRELPFRDPHVAMNYARSCLEARHAEKAAGILGKLPPATDAVTRFDAGMLFANMGRYKEAASQFELARKGYPDPYQVAFNLTLAYVRMRDFQPAIRTAQGYLAQGDPRAELYNLLAQALEGSGQTMEAYNALRTATKLDPKDEDNYLDLSALCVDHANYDLGMEIVDIGISYLPRSDRLHFQRGTLLAIKGQSAQAAADFETAGKLAPEKSLPAVAQGLVLLEMGEPAKSVTLLRQKAAEPRADYLVFYIFGEALTRTGAAQGSPEEIEAVKALERSIHLNPNFAQSRGLLGKLLLRAGEVDRAVAELEKALELDPEETNSAYQLAQAYRRKGNTARAKELFARVDKAKTEGREKFMTKTLLRLVREGAR